MLSPRSQKNHKILVNISNKKFWGGAQIGFKVPPGAAAKIYQKFSHIL